MELYRNNLNFIIYRFVVREFVYDEEQIHAGKDQMTKLTADKKKQYVIISRSQNIVSPLIVFLMYHVILAV